MNSHGSDVNRKPSSVALSVALEFPISFGKDVMDLLWETNGETMEEIKEAGEMKGSVLELFRDEIEEKEKAAETKGANQQANMTAEKMLRKNKPLSEIVDFSGLTEAAVRALAEKLKLTVVAG